MDSQHYPVYYQSYIDKVPEGNLIDLLEFSLNESFKSLVMIPEDKGNYAYEEGKWTIKQILQHVIDTERIFNYRALAFARGEKNEIMGFDHNAYADHGKAENRSIKSLLEEWKRLRASTIDLFKSFSEAQLEIKGKANGKELEVKQIGYVIIGHEMHHVSVIEQKYL